MATMKQWEKEAEKLTREQAIKVADAIKTLTDWEFFHEEFKWTQYHIVRMVVEDAHGSKNV